MYTFLCKPNAAKKANEGRKIGGISLRKWERDDESKRKKTKTYIGRCEGRSY